MTRAGVEARALSLAAILVACASPARAEVERFAVIVGNDIGSASDTPLRYAEADAARVYEVLRDLGGFKPANMVLLAGEDSATTIDTLIAVNERVRAALTQDGTEALLFVYYSGHSDRDALHLGRSQLSTRLLSQLVGGSAATFRLLVLDACRSGAVTRRKGGRVVGGGPLMTEDTLPGNGLAVLAASAAHEDAQESEEIGGSFFTHALVSGLMGAADSNGDGAVSLGEAYDHAYEATLRASSRTAYGMQHPTFRYDFAGQGALILTHPQLFASSRAVLNFPSGVDFLVLRDSSGGNVVGEVGASDRRRSLSVRPGRYFVRGRGADVLFEGEYNLAQGTRTRIDPATMRRTEYAQLVRKGARSSGLAHAIRAGPALRTALDNSDTPCVGAFVGYALELPHFGLRARTGFCSSRFENRRISAAVNEYDVELRLTRSWDLAALSFDLGIGVGGALFTQHFETSGDAPSRHSFAPYVLLGAGAAIALGGGYSAGIDLAGETHFPRFEPDDEREQGRGLGDFALRATVMAARAF